VVAETGHTMPEMTLEELEAEWRHVKIGGHEDERRY